MWGIIFCIACMVGMVLLAIFAKWFLAAMCVLTGDKESLHQFGNLCDKDTPAPPQDDWYWNPRTRTWHRNWQDNWRNRGEGNM